MIRLENINKYYDVGEEKITVLENINFSIESGEFVAIMGPSGSGKSTLINLLGFIDRNFSGQYYFKEKEIADFKDNELSKIRNQSVGFVFQNFSLIENLTVFENVELPLLYNGANHNKTKEEVKSALKRVGLANKMSQLPKQLSGGQQQRVAIARALINQPSFIIADEPTGALDTHTTSDIMQLFKQLNTEGVTIILVTHDPETVVYCDRLLKIRDGKMVEEVLQS
ncbi:ABC transporter ATP-binding protein [Enterococcus phoeniculicola]|jgi:putative ABC transport system ATP-binding protein|uniref:ABC transporter ATP-binding protein n=1 Tax=Enterococcus phoeniculicola ATCC BAA-412 TaxID=1158610 RepID=R3TYE9_9ENTE|nr:ABC transporter ATP-binding protein [Enterococcus phoeniculicola]EOL46629.1 ABC transporter ATP-binding protein [Enterococcus phoeniculicola ATCC BAA-412]EOT77210.1 ABC transporter ATP-binding protein [Enterococcus phoeniculicola ATCC BAA-412]